MIPITLAVIVLLLYLNFPKHSEVIIMLSDGTGSEVMQRISGPMIGGMISTLVLTLLVIPVIFYLWKRAGIKTR